MFAFAFHIQCKVIICPLIIITFKLEAPLLGTNNNCIDIYFESNLWNINAYRQLLFLSMFNIQTL